MAQAYSNGELWPASRWTWVQMVVNRRLPSPGRAHSRLD
jgi:hypothetical protein